MMFFVQLNYMFRYILGTYNRVTEMWDFFYFRDLHLLLIWWLLPGFISEEKLNIDLNASNNKIITY